VKLLDFGIARAAQRAAETRSGTWKGKFPYMSPEQCRMGDIDRRSDVFALGSVVWEMLTGRRLFDAEMELQLVHAITAEDAPAPSTVRPDVPAELDAILLQALARDRAARWQTAEQMQLALEGFARKAGLLSSPIELARFVKELPRVKLRESAPVRVVQTAATCPLAGASTGRKGRVRWIAAGGGGGGGGARGGGGGWGRRRR